MRNLGRTTLAVAASLMAAGSMALGAARAHAQFAPNARPIFGGRMLATGFMPDPVVLNGQAGGPVSANQINPSCRGYISPQPSHVISSRTGFRNIRFVVAAQSDLTMMVMLSNGQVLCDDDSGEAMNPLIEAAAPPGDIRIWIGAYSSGNVGTPYSLGVTELAHITANNLMAPGPGPGPMPPPPPPPMVGGINPNLPPAFGTISLAQGFMPDPHIAAGNAGGPVPGSQVQGRGTCRGHITPQPSHVLMSRTGFRNLRIVTNAGGFDVTLIVQTPDGQFYCDDDGGGQMNPMVTVASPPGPIRVWVGTYSQGRTGPYNIGFSELGITSANLPPPGGGPMPGPGPVVVQPPQPPQPPQIQQTLVQMQLMIPVTLFGPGMDAGTVAVWQPRNAPEIQISMSGRDIVAAGSTLASVPPSMRDPVITVVAQRRGTLLVRAEQPPGVSDGGQALLLQVAWSGAPTVVQRWTGTAIQRPPRWAR